MTVRWYRSRAFWAGLTGLVMLVGSFVFYARTLVSLNWSSAVDHYSISKGPDLMAVSHADLRHPDLQGGPPPKTGFLWHAYKFSEDVPVGRLVPPFKITDQPHGKSIFIAQWMVVVIYLLAWAGFMVWWLRRKRRLMAESGLFENPSRPQ